MPASWVFVILCTLFGCLQPYACTSAVCNPLSCTLAVSKTAFRYFADVVEQRLAPDDAVVIITHEPCWLLEWFWQHPAAANLRCVLRC